LAVSTSWPELQVPTRVRTLVIETATPVLSVAYFDGTSLISADHRPLGRGHAEALLPAIAALPDGGRADHILVSCGPGSFTGIRVGLAAARALGFAWRCPVVGYNTLALVGLCADLPAGTAYSVAIPGGHGEIFLLDHKAGVQSLVPDQAARQLLTDTVVGAAAAELVALRGRGQAYPAEADARQALLLPPGALLAVATPLYGRQPDAKLAGDGA
jgi:tRNA threonylcarbamoyl adenosine modification protein YeaZ